jgi:Mg2+ and Co2+ transporter CorA
MKPINVETKLKEKNKDSDYIIKAKLEEKDEQLTAMSEKYDTDIELLKDAIKDMQQLLKNPERLMAISKATTHSTD